MTIRAIPFKGFGDFTLYQSVEEAKKTLKNKGIKYSCEVWNNKWGANPVPWTVIRFGDEAVNLFFAKDKLFKIYLCEGSDAELPNGIRIGMKMKEALKIDPKLEFDDWEEDYQSPNGYWIGDNLNNGTIASINIFIKEAEDDDLFYEYKW